MIKIENVTKKFPGMSIPAVKDLNLEVKEGDVCILVGPSGCGKTTTMKMINRIYEPSSGAIYINGQDALKMDPIKLRLGIGYVIQEIGLFPHMTIEENVATVPTEKKWPKDKIKKRVDEMLTLVGLDPREHGHRYPSALSGGQRQRVGVARAMASDPPIMLMDEPFGAVDPITRARLQNEFLRIQERVGKTIVFVTHDIDEAIKMGDTIAVMREGQLIQHATPSDLLSTPANEFVENLVGRNRSIKRLHLIRIREILDEVGRVDPATVDMSVDDIKKRINESDIRSVMVVDKNNKLKGIIGINDLKKKTGEAAADYVQEVADSITDDATLNDALSVMLECGEGYVAVVNEDDQYQGTITLGDLLNVVKEDN
ncbi:MAG: glycine betaine ABC transporter ATP-binding protein [Firmicutes bacterium ML8_F2]|jgi:osmoprotectant transport system ATP-binding protein|nr:MAG: glycine betaine ABC transporter ATP-binding protein [Firmicutes bacterium ML8_F2]